MSDKQTVQVSLLDLNGLAEAGERVLRAAEQHALGMALLTLFAAVLVAGLVAAGWLVRTWKRPVGPCVVPQMRLPEPPSVPEQSPAPPRQRQPQGRQRKAMRAKV